MSTDHVWDAIVIGTGSGGKIAAQQLAEAGRRVLAVELTRFGGECPYLACVPAKSLLASAQAGSSWADAVRARDEITDDRDDHAGRESLDEQGVTTLRGRGRLLARDGDHHRVEVTTGAEATPQVHAAPVVVLGPGSRPTIPPVEGLADLDYWTSDRALSAQDQPASLIILGGGAIGCELSQAFATLGSSVDLIEIADTLLPAEESWAGELLAEALRADGIRVHLGDQPDRAETLGDGRVRVTMSDGTEITGTRLLVAGGRSPNTDELGLALVGAATDDSGAVVVDTRCRVLDAQGAPVLGLYAVGDVTAESNYTHSANYQAKVVAADVETPGDSAFGEADYRAIPRVVYTDPPVYGVGLTREQAEQRGLAVSSGRFDVTTVERARLLEISSKTSGGAEVRGGLELLADPAAGVLVGATAVGPQADAWGAELALAIRAQIPISLLRAHVRAFPTWSEAITAALDKL